MSRTASALAALTLSLATLGAAAPALAAGGIYRAELATPPAAHKVIVRDLIWTCDAGTCTASRNNSRPATLCSALARRLGPVRSFSVEGRALPADQLEKCNAAAG